jgi:hypothetical protein
MRTLPFAQIGILAALTSLAGCAVSNQPAPPQPEQASGVEGEEAAAPAELRVTVGPEGGELVGAADGPLAGVRLVLPRGAVAESTEIVLRASIDPVPLANTAERVGPQISVEPAGLVLNAPAQLTVPFDAALRAQWAATDADCKVWVREGEGWKGADQIASSHEGVTIELRALSTAAAGVRVIPQSLSCAVTNNCPALPRCVAGSTAPCMVQLPSPSATMFDSSTMTVANGIMYYLHSPGPDTFTVAKFDLLGTSSATTLLQSISRRPSAALSVRGRLAVNATDVWAGLVGIGNVRFRPVNPFFNTTAAFDTSSALQPAGVVIDPNGSSAPVRLTRRTVSGNLGLYGEQNAQTWEIARLGSSDFVGARPKRGAASADPFVFFGTALGAGEFRPLGQAVRVADPCGNALTVNVEAGPNERFVACSDGRLFSSAVNRTFNLGMTISSMAMADDGLTLYAVDASRAELVKVSLIPILVEGGQEVITRIPLTTAAPGTPGHDRMLPRAVRFESNTRSVYVVTRGLANNGIPEIYNLDNL